ncbi:MAG: S41 family peptidase [Minisyncoccia bacterium]
MEEHENDSEEKGTGHGLTKLAVLFALVAALAFGGGLVVGAGGADLGASIPFISDGLNAAPDTDADLSDFWKAWNVLGERFVQTHASSTLPESKEKVWGAIEGLAESFGDPYTVFMRPEDAKIFAEDIAGNFSGVGMEIGLNKERVLTVISPLKGTPAERAGILSGDLVVLIDGESTDGMSTDEAVKLIRGERGTTVTFKMVRKGEPLDIKVVRDTIEVPTIEYALESASGVYVVSLYSFTANSPQLMNRAFSEFRASGSKKLLIDLRGNPGGYLEAAVRIAGNFLPEGTVVVTEDYQGHEENIVHRTTGGGGIPAGTSIAVLLDQGSASASEILAGALQDEEVATIVGTRSFGKGSVQELVKVGQGSLKVTVAKWLTPSGRSISDGGLTPDIEIERTQEDVTAGKDPQKERAIQFLTTGK